MEKLLKNPATFVILYIVFMIPTYLLPYMGSNSSLINAASASSGAGINPFFWVHLFALGVLVELVLLRGKIIAKTWLAVFPALALAFDLTPGLSSTPLVPTLMHLLAIILGVSETNTAIKK